MLIKICYADKLGPVVFAAHELKKYLGRISPAAEIAVLSAREYRADWTGALWLRVDEGLAGNWPRVLDTAVDDAVSVDVSGGSGVIAGVNARSVLLAAYRYLRELGCAWPRPGLTGEIIPRVSADKLAATRVKLLEAPSYRHRGMCVEGAVSEDHIASILDWLPKVGMNGWFDQFNIPFAFYDRWYSHLDNDTLESAPLTPGEIAAIVEALLPEIEKRGLLYHAAGHGWTCEPFGLDGLSWEPVEDKIPEETRPCLAEVNHVRGLWGGIPLNTNLCYSNPAVLERMTDAISARCEERPEIGYMHVWLADGFNNHCECDGCKDTLPADFYVRILNRVDEKLTAKGLGTRIVFLIYMDLLWAPQRERLANPARFVLMFAPISRTYSRSYAGELGADEPVSPADLAPYERNRLTLPRSVAENVARLRAWREIFAGDSFCFDYHFMWDHFRDLGGMKIARTVFEDMQGLGKLGLDGMVSCQVQRAFFPSGLGPGMMAAALWNAEAGFDAESERFMKATYGKGWRAVKRYLDKLGELCDPVYLRHETPQRDKRSAEQLKKARKLVLGFRETLDDTLAAGRLDDLSVRESWTLLRLHSDYAELLLDALILKARGAEARELAAAWRRLAKWARRNEPALRDVFDVYIFLRTMKNAVLGEDADYA